MVQKVKTMAAPEMERVCRKMADAFLDYEMTGKNLGMCEHLDREHFYRFVRSYFELAVRSGTLYSTGDHHEGFFIFVTPETKGSLYGSVLQLKWMLSAFGFKKGMKYVKEIMDSGPYLASAFRKEKRPFTKIEFIAVDKEHQGRGYMRKMIDCAFSASDRLGLPCILTTDDEKKVKIYEHFGMRLARRHVLSERATYYEMLREARRQGG